MATTRGRAASAAAVVVAALVLTGTAGGAVAARLIGSADIKNNSIRSVDIKDGQVRTRDVAAPLRRAASSVPRVVEWDAAVDTSEVLRVDGDLSLALACTVEFPSLLVTADAGAIRSFGSAAWDDGTTALGPRTQATRAVYLGSDNHLDLVMAHDSKGATAYQLDLGVTTSPADGCSAWGVLTPAG